MTAIDATFSDFRPVKSRGVYQIILEVPAEKANAVLAALGGVPVFGSEQWVGVALLDPSKFEAKAPESAGVAQQVERPICNREAAGSNPAAGTTTRERRPFSSLPRSEQAALACRDVQFCRWLGCEDATRTQTAVTYLRTALVVTSRRELDADPIAASRWDSLYARYRQETGLDPESRGG